MCVVSRFMMRQDRSGGGSGGWGSWSGVWVFRHTAYKVFISMIYDARGMSGAITLVSHQGR